MYTLLKNIFFVIFLFISYIGVSQQKPISDTAIRKVIPEFDFADIDRDGLITYNELDYCIDKSFEGNPKFYPNDVYNLSQYFRGEYKIKSLPVSTTNTSTTQTAAVESPPEALSFFDKYISVGAQLTGMYQLSTGLQKTEIDGPVSLPYAWQDQTLTLFTIPFEFRPWKGAELNFTPEFSAGNGIGNGAGVAAYPNALYGFPTYRPYILRAQYKQRFAIDTSDKKGLKEFNFTLGQFVIQEVLSVNPYSGDPKMDFSNFSHTMLNAWDASTTAYGYTQGLALSAQFKRSQLNFIACAVNKQQGGPKLDYNIAQGRSLNLQYVHEFDLFNKPGTIRALGFYNTTFSGEYDKFEYDSLTATAFFSDSLKSYQGKYGFGIDADLALTENLGLFARYSWGDGKTESWGYTQCDASINAGINLALGKVNRPNDAIGICGSYNTISAQHQKFLKNGGTGFMIGDGFLNYAPEMVGEFFYRVNIIKSCFLSFNYQYMMNVGYNADRGNTHFVGGRFHVEF